MKAWKRVEFVDFLRGSAVVLMVIYHVFFDLSYFGKIHVESEFFWFAFPRFIGAMFIFISGISLTLAKVKYGKKLTAVAVRKGLKYLLLGFLISFLTLPTGCYVRFGILHFFGVAVVLGSFFAKLRLFSALLGLAFILAGVEMEKICIDGEYLLWIGIKPTNFCTLDYYPLLPWFGFMLLGIYAGNSFNLDLRIPKGLKPITFLGRRSLMIYLLQHPVILFFMHVWYGDVLQQIF